jgi:hypothetical protein
MPELLCGEHNFQIRKRSVAHSSRQEFLKNLFQI